MIERIHDGRIELALILRASFSQPGVHFFTPGEYSQQLGYMNHPKGHVIAPHVHLVVRREVEFTKEVLVVRSGRVRVDFYSDQQKYLQSTILEPGDIVLLAQGGHGFEMLEPTEMIEIKQGPYAGDRDKVRFEGVPSTEVKILGAIT